MPGKAYKRASLSHQVVFVSKWRLLPGSRVGSMGRGGLRILPSVPVRNRSNKVGAWLLRPHTCDVHFRQNHEEPQGPQHKQHGSGRIYRGNHSMIKHILMQL